MGRVVGQTLANGSIYRIDYFATIKDRVARARVTDPSGHVLGLANDEDGYTVRTIPVRFPAALGTSPPQNYLASLPCPKVNLLISSSTSSSLPPMNVKDRA